MANSSNATDSCPLSSHHIQGEDETTYWPYIPSQAAAVVLLVEFLILTIVILRSVFKTKTWDCLVFALGGLFEITGYLTRTIASQRINAPVLFTIQYGCIEGAAVFFAACLHLILNRVARRLRDRTWLCISTARLATLLFFGDLVALFLVVSITLLFAVGASDGAYISLSIGVRGIQILSAIIFDITTYLLQKNIQKAQTSVVVLPMNWEKDISTIGSVNIIMTWRLALKLLRVIRCRWAVHEWTFYISDALPMILAMIVFSAKFPSYSDLEQVTDTSMVFSDKQY